MRFLVGLCALGAIASAGLLCNELTEVRRFSAVRASTEQDAEPRWVPTGALAQAEPALATHATTERSSARGPSPFGGVPSTEPANVPDRGDDIDGDTAELEPCDPSALERDDCRQPSQVLSDGPTQIAYGTRVITVETEMFVF